MAKAAKTAPKAEPTAEDFAAAFSTKPTIPEFEKEAPSRATWTGLLKFLMVTIPVKSYSAVSENKIEFNQLHNNRVGKDDEGNPMVITVGEDNQPEPCRCRLEQRMYCPACNVTVPKEDIVKGYQYSKGEYVVIDEQVIDGMKPVSDSVMEITEFVPLSEIDPIIYENANFLSPDKGGKHAFEVIRQSMLKNNVVGIASYISRGSEHTMIIRPYQNGLVAQRIWLDTEVRSFDKWTPEVISDKELEVGGTLIQHMLEQKFDYATLKNKYLENKRQYVNSVIAGEAAPVVETEAVPEPTVDIMAAFTASVNAPRKTRAKKAA